VKPGRIIRTFAAKDGRQVVLRAPSWNDLDDLLELINSLVEERADIIVDQKLTREEEIDWLSERLARLEKDEDLYLVAEVNGKVIGSSELAGTTRGTDRYLGRIGIILRDGFRELGIGTEMMMTLVEQAKEKGLKVVTLGAYATNERAQHVYRKAGFKEVGRIPMKFFKDGRYIDEIVMVKVLE
jgi:RimJ/RimL family protein N-acetyltransferase